MRAREITLVVSFPRFLTGIMDVMDTSRTGHTLFDRMDTCRSNAAGMLSRMDTGRGSAGMLSRMDTGRSAGMYSRMDTSRAYAEPWGPSGGGTLEGLSGKLAKMMASQLQVGGAPLSQADRQASWRGGRRPPPPWMATNEDNDLGIILGDGMGGGNRAARRSSEYGSYYGDSGGGESHRQSRPSGESGGNAAAHHHPPRPPLSRPPSGGTVRGMAQSLPPTEPAKSAVGVSPRTSYPGAAALGGHPQAYSDVPISREGVTVERRGAIHPRENHGLEDSGPNRLRRVSIPGIATQIVSKEDTSNPALLNDREGSFLGFGKLPSRRYRDSAIHDLR